MTFRVIIDPDMLKKTKKFLKPAHQRKLNEFLEILPNNPVPTGKFDIKKFEVLTIFLG